MRTLPPAIQPTDSRFEWSWMSPSLGPINRALNKTAAERLQHLRVAGRQIVVGLVPFLPALPSGLDQPYQRGIPVGDELERCRGSFRPDHWKLLRRHG